MCQIWFHDRHEPTISKASLSQEIFTGHINFSLPQPYIISCDPLPLTDSNRVPLFVSLVYGEPCQQATNAIKIQYHPLESGHKRQKIGVCLKVLNFPSEDVSLRLIEWLELLRQLGASKIFIYVLKVNRNIEKVLNYYSKSGFIDLIETTFGNGHVSNFERLYLKRNFWENCWNEVIGVNDCLYNNMYKFEYLTELDIDEVIVPLKHENWTDLVEHLPPGWPSYNFRNIYFLDDFEVDESVPEYGHMMRHVVRSKYHTPYSRFVKSFQSTDAVFAMHNHFHM